MGGGPKSTNGASPLSPRGFRRKTGSVFKADKNLNAATLRYIYVHPTTYLDHVIDVRIEIE